MNDTAQTQPAGTQQPQIVTLGNKIKNQAFVPQTQAAQATSAAQAQQPLQPQTAGVQPTQPQQSQDDTAQRLTTFESVLDELQNTVPHGMVQAVDAATNTLNPQQPVSSSKERIEPIKTPDTQVVDAGGGVQTVEQERVPEIPVEVESYLQRVEDHRETAPTEVVIADGTTEVPTNQYPSKPVIVLPFTEEEEKEGMKQSPKNSFRWLVEFGHKIIKMFTGKVIYKQDTE